MRIARSEPGSQSASMRRVVMSCAGANAPARGASGTDGERGHQSPPSKQRTALWPPNPNEFEIARGARPSVSSARGPSGT